MNRSSAQRNIELISIVANHLEELLNEVVFVGGVVAGLLTTDKAAADVRFTVDVDCIVNVITKAAYYSFAEKLREKGFKELLEGNHPICRWECDGVLVDVVPVEKTVLGFSNRWYKDSLSNALVRKINKNIQIKIISAPYFLATKLEAFKDRGKGDFLLSHDLEDIIAIIDGRPSIVKDVAACAAELKSYLSSSFLSIMSNNLFTQALPGHLNYSSEVEGRKKIVEERINAIIKLGE